MRGSRVNEVLPTGKSDDTAIPLATESLAKWARETPDAVAVIEGDVIRTYAQLAEEVARAVAVLRSLGIGGAQVVGIDCESRHLQLVLILAIECLGGAHFVFLGARFQDDASMFAACDVLLFERPNALAAAHPCLIELSETFVETLSRADIGDDIFQTLTAPLDLDAPGRISMTSGTTGRPKLIENSRRSYLAIASALRPMMKYQESRYSFVTAYTYAQAGTYSHGLLALAYGRSVTFCDPATLLATAGRSSGCNTLMVIGDAVNYVAHAEATGQRIPHCLIRTLGASLSLRLRERMNRWLTPDVVSTYSSNETSYIACSFDGLTETILPGVSVRIVDEAGQDLPIGEIGTVMARTPTMMTRYLRQEAETEARLIDGWFRTSDLGVIPEEGQLVVLGRADDVLNVFGMKLHPSGIEQQLQGLDGVREAILMTLPDADDVERLYALIEMHDKQDEAAIRRQASAVLARHVPQCAIRFVTAMPRTPTGKVRRQLLKDSLVAASLPRG